MGEQQEYIPSGVASQERTPDDIAEKYADLAVTQALDTIKERFENPQNPENVLAYHRKEHTNAVIQRVELILAALKASLREALLGKIAAAFHDTKQDWEPKFDANTKGLKRIRFAKQNEDSSAGEAALFMQQANHNEEGREIFTSQDIQSVVDAIMVTIPGFNGKTVVQENLHKDSPLVVRALALADLGAAGMDGAEQYLQEGDANFREENLDIARAIESGQPITPDQVENFKQRMLGWTKFQPKFAEGRQEMLEQEISGLPPEQQDPIRSLFNKFSESIQAATDRIARREAMTFPELVKDMGYAKEPVMAE